MAVRSPHKKVHANCEYAASTWAECDKARDSAYVDWQAMQQVILAYNVVVAGDWKAYRKEKSVFAQLVQMLAGERDELTNADGNASEAGFVLRIRAAIARVIAGDLPGYNLYRPATPPEEAEAH